MRTIQKLILVGYAGRDPVLKQVRGSDHKVATISLAIQRKRSGKDIPPIWFQVSFFGALGERAAALLHEGDLVYIEGRLDADQETGTPRLFDLNGKTASAFDVYVTDFRQLEKRDGAGSDAPDDYDF